MFSQRPDRRLRFEFRTSPTRAAFGDAVSSQARWGRTYDNHVGARRARLRIQLASDTASLFPLLATPTGRRERSARDARPHAWCVASALNEIALSSGVGSSSRRALPIDRRSARRVNARLDPLYVANEGIFVAFVPAVWRTMRWRCGAPARRALLLYWQSWTTTWERVDAHRHRWHPHRGLATEISYHASVMRASNRTDAEDDDNAEEPDLTDYRTYYGGARFTAQLRSTVGRRSTASWLGRDTGRTHRAPRCLVRHVHRVLRPTVPVARSLPYVGMRVEVEQHAERNPSRVGNSWCVSAPGAAPERILELLERVVRSCPHTIRWHVRPMCGPASRCRGCGHVASINWSKSPGQSAEFADTYSCFARLRRHSNRSLSCATHQEVGMAMLTRRAPFPIGIHWRSSSCCR